MSRSHTKSRQRSSEHVRLAGSSFRSGVHNSLKYHRLFDRHGLPVGSRSLTTRAIGGERRAL